jgi:hypothetical protein
MGKKGSRFYFEDKNVFQGKELQGRTEKNCESNVSMVQHLVYTQTEYLQNSKKVPVLLILIMTEQQR